VAFSPDGKRLLSGSRDCTARVWDAERGTEILSLKGHTDLVLSVAFSPDGKRLLTGSLDGTAKVWDAERGTELLSLRGDTIGVLSVALSPDGKRLLTGSLDGTAKVWDAPKGTELLSLKGHTDAVYSVAFSPDGKRVFAWDLTGKVLAWTVADGKPAATAGAPPLPPPGSATSPDGRLLARPDWPHVAVIDLLRPAPAGSPWPLPNREERQRYHAEQAARAEKDRQHFAAAFHLGRLLLDDPGNADLKRRRDLALKRHAGLKPKEIGKP
jgi:hypothetical protein